MAEGLEPAELLPVGMNLHRRYVIEGVIARGGYGATYDARDEKFRQRVAIKEYFPSALAARAAGSAAVSPRSKACGALFFLGSEMFYRQHLALIEARGSCNVVSVLAAFFENGTSYAVMERLEGVTLETFLRLRRRRLTPEEAMFIAASLADALLVVHSLNTLHYDVNARSIFLGTDGSVKLIDFGAAKASLRARREVDDTEPWIDLGALGRTLYESMSGQTVRGGEIAPNPYIPAPFYDLLLRMLHQDGARRFASVFEYRHALACLEVGATCPAVSAEDAAAALPAIKRAETKRAETSPEEPEEPKPQKKSIFDRALDSLQEAVEYTPQADAPEQQLRRKHLNRRLILLYAGIVIFTLAAALIIKSLTR